MRRLWIEAVELRTSGTEPFAKIGLVLINTGNISTFLTLASDSKVDLVYVNTTLARRIVWFVSERYIHSDHHMDHAAMCVSAKLEIRDGP